jgi:hypothetical protein
VGVPLLPQVGWASVAGCCCACFARSRADLCNGVFLGGSSQALSSANQRHSTEVHSACLSACCVPPVQGEERLAARRQQGEGAADSDTSRMSLGLQARMHPSRQPVFCPLLLVCSHNVMPTDTPHRSAHTA